MKKSYIAVLVVALMSVGSLAHGQEEPAGKKMAVGGHLLLGGAGIAEDYGDTTLYEEDLKARFAGGFGGFFNYYLTDMIALYGGLEFLGKGAKASGDSYELKRYTRHMDLPLGVLVNLSNLHLGGALVPSITLSGKTKFDIAGLDGEDDFDDDDWDDLQRFNLGLRLFAGYAIPVGPIAIIPGLMYQMDLLNASKGDAKDADVKLRNINLMFTLGVEYGF